MSIPTLQTIGGVPTLSSAQYLGNNTLIVSMLQGQTFKLNSYDTLFNAISLDSGKTLFSGAVLKALQANPKMTDPDFANLLLMLQQASNINVSISFIDGLKAAVGFIAGAIAVDKAVTAITSPPVSGPSTGSPTSSIPTGGQITGTQNYTNGVQSQLNAPSTNNNVIPLVLAGGIAANL